MVIYTKKGDEGETSLYDAKNTQRKRVSKDSLRIEAIGAADELNSFLGVCRFFNNDPRLIKLLKDIQNDLFTIGSILAGSKLRFTVVKTRRLEKVIDELEGTLPVLKNFILPGGAVGAAQLHYARTVARRAERKVVTLSKSEKVKLQILAYLNRLSDYLFILARNVNYEARISEDIWKRGER